MQEGRRQPDRPCGREARDGRLDEVVGGAVQAPRLASRTDGGDGVRHAASRGVGARRALVRHVDWTAVADAAQGPVVLTANEQVWISVKDGAATLKEGLLESGQSYEVPATARAPTLTTGKPEALRISVGTADAPPVGPAATTVTDVSLLGPDLLRGPRTTPTATPAAAPTAAPARQTPRRAPPATTPVATAPTDNAATPTN